VSLGVKPVGALHLDKPPGLRLGRLDGGHIERVETRSRGGSLRVADAGSSKKRSKRGFQALGHELPPRSLSRIYLSNFHQAYSAQPHFQATLQLLLLFLQRSPFAWFGFRTPNMQNPAFGAGSANLPGVERRFYESSDAVATPDAGCQETPD
jgi:hypothetical protein